MDSEGEIINFCSWEIKSGDYQHGIVKKWYNIILSPEKNVAELEVLCR